MGWQDIVALSVAALALFIVLRTFYRAFSGCGSCGSCSASPQSTSTTAAADRVAQVRGKRLPLVTLDQVGRPD